MKRGWLALVSVLAALAPAAVARAEVPSRAQAIADAITELDVKRAQELLEKADSASPTIAFERARLAIYVGDCDKAQAVLASAELSSTPEGSGLGELAKSCARATAASVVVEDAEAGVWIRLQDEADRALVPLLVDVATRARSQVEADLGTDLPRPLRIDLVRDLFTLSAISGLPVNAAETTGTVAVARWGRVTMISPRATQLGYPWQDTLAHEIAHLGLTRATRDHAPLWLQEGMAKREETRWRAPRPFDAVPPADAVSRAALESGRSVGVDKLGPSIAMLPTPEAAATAFSEVTSFVAFLARENGDPMLKLLFRDLKAGSVDDAGAALRSATGYDLGQWIARWQMALRALPPEPVTDPHGGKRAKRIDDPARRTRLGDLLFQAGYARPAALQYEPSVKGLPNEAALRARWSRALCDAGRTAEAVSALGGIADVRSVHGGWHALTGRFRAEAGDRAAAEEAFVLGIAVDPLSEEVACEGRWKPRDGGKAPELPVDARRRALCEAARAIPRD